MSEFVLTLSCPDRIGIVVQVAGYLHHADRNVLDSQQFGDRTPGRFFMRVHVESLRPTPTTRRELCSGFIPVAAEFAMDRELHDTAVQPRVLIMVPKAGHCLNDLLYRRGAEPLGIDVPLVVGNHLDLAPLAAAHGVAFEHVPADPYGPLAAPGLPGRVPGLPRPPPENPLRKPETVHGITSLTAWQANPADLLAGNRGHWEVEVRHEVALCE
jgi:predicted amino acid-binding ACT domain protein